MMNSQILPPPCSNETHIKLRESNFELLRLLSQFYIVLYHTIAFEICLHNNHIFFKAIQLPLHVGVPLFVLLSGYFGIRPSTKGFIKLMGVFIVYSLFEIVYNVINADGMRNAVGELFFLSKTHFWFIKTYLFLFLASPMLNLYIEKSSSKQVWYMLLVLGFVSIYMGTSGGDETMKSGKNLVNFMFWYLVGHQIHAYYKQWNEKFSLISLLLLYLFLNTLLVVGYMMCAGSGIANAIWRYSFAYSSPLLLLNAVLLFMIFGKISFQSKLINWLATSSLAIYLIHSNRPYVVTLRTHIALWVNSQLNSAYLVTISCAFVSIIVICACITIDKMLGPVWYRINTWGNSVYNRLGY